VGCLAGGDGQGPKSVEDGHEKATPSASPAQVQHDPAAGNREPAGGGEQPQPQPLGFPPAGRVVGQGEQPQLGGELAGQRHQRTPDPVLVEVE